MNHCLRFTVWFFLILSITTRSVSIAEQVTDKIKKPVEDSITIRQNTQKDIEKWSEKKSILNDEYDLLVENEKRLIIERKHLIQELEAMQNRIIDLENQIMSMEQISEKLKPFLYDIYVRLLDSVDQGAPFLKEERSERLVNLKKTLDDTQIVLGEKFRKVMEALVLEADYGNTLEVYQEKILLTNEDVLVNVLRLGRISLFFETLDQQTTGYFDLAKNQWKPLPQSANRDIRIAMEIGSKRRPADIVTLPLGRIGVK
jgi:hypothetical protein